MLVMYLWRCVLLQAAETACRVLLRCRIAVGGSILQSCGRLFEYAVLDSHHAPATTTRPRPTSHHRNPQPHPAALPPRAGTSAHDTNPIWGVVVSAVEGLGIVRSFGFVFSFRFADFDRSVLIDLVFPL